jgi:hypothetical protein
MRPDNSIIAFLAWLWILPCAGAEEVYPLITWLLLARAPFGVDITANGGYL